MKAFDVLIKALAILKQRGRPLSVTIAGDGPDATQLKALAESLGIADLAAYLSSRWSWTQFAHNQMAALVTGSASNIGRAIALALAREGAAVRCVDVDADRNGSVVAEIRQAMHEGRLHAAMHSLKDMPGNEETPGLIIAATLPRDAANDALVLRSGV